MILSYILLPQLSIPLARELKRQHPELAPATPHKLRHTAATLAKKAGRSIDEISEALTHSDQSITKTYIRLFTIAIYQKVLGFYEQRN